MNVKERIKIFIKSKGLSVRSFEIKCLLSNGLINNITESISKTSIDKISNVFPELNIDWLLTGNGSMLKTDITNNNQLNTEGMTIEEELRELKNRIRFLEDQVAFYAREHREFVRREEMEVFFARNRGNLNKQTIA